MPSFPRSSLRKMSQGVAVCQIEVNEIGKVKDVSIWESPDPLIARAVKRAVLNWKFKNPTMGGKPVPIRGKLTFYFQIQNGKGVVRNAKPFEQ